LDTIAEALIGPRASVPVRPVILGGGGPDYTLAGGVSSTTSLGLSSVWRCLDVLSNGVSQLPWREMRGTLDLPPSRLVARPRASMTRREWVSLVVGTLALYDVAYLLKVGGADAEGIPLGLHPLDPAMVTPATIGPQAWSLAPPEHYWIGSTRVDADQLVVLRRSPQPGIGEMTGGVLRLARVTFAAAIAAETYASRYWQSGGAPVVALETDAHLNGLQAEEISDRWAERRARGPDYAPVLSGGVKAKPFGADPTEQAAVEARREMVADVARYFGVPTRMVNAPAGDSETYTTTESANLDLIRFTLQNYIGAIEDAITDQLPGGRRMVMDNGALTRGTQLARAQAWQLALNGDRPWMTADEVREAEGLPPMEPGRSMSAPIMSQMARS
jgi:HK97 family phage portal protein